MWGAAHTHTQGARSPEASNENSGGVECQGAQGVGVLAGEKSVKRNQTLFVCNIATRETHTHTRAGREYILLMVAPAADAGDNQRGAVDCGCMMRQSWSQPA